MSGRNTSAAIRESVKFLVVFIFFKTRLSELMTNDRLQTKNVTGTDDHTAPPVINELTDYLLHV